MNSMNKIEGRPAKPSREQLIILSRIIRVIVRGLVINQGFAESEKRDRNIAELLVHRRRDSATLRLRGRRHEFAGLSELRYYGQSYCFYPIRELADIARAIELIRVAVLNALQTK